MVKEIKVGRIKIGGSSPLILIAGPCVIESRDSALYHAQRLKKITSHLKIPFIFKSSYDKANRTSIDSYRGPGLGKGIKILKEIKEKLKIPILSDVHCRAEIEEVAKVLDIIQVPAFLCRQTDFVVAAAKTKRVINIKKGQFLSPWEIRNIVEKITRAGNRKILVTERGSSFGYNNLVSDMRALEIMRGFGFPVIFDATHSVQLPGREGESSGGERKYVAVLARAAVAAGCEGLFIEVHKDPDRALCDGPNMIAFKELERLLKIVKRIDEIVKGDRYVR